MEKDHRRNGFLAERLTQKLSPSNRDKLMWATFIPTIMGIGLDLYTHPHSGLPDMARRASLHNFGSDYYGDIFLSTAPVIGSILGKHVIRHLSQGTRFEKPLGDFANLLPAATTVLMSTIILLIENSNYSSLGGNIDAIVGITAILFAGTATELVWDRFRRKYRATSPQEPQSLVSTTHS